MPDIEGDMRRHIAEFLPEAMQTALRSYKEFFEKSDTSDAENFKKHHDACKVAIAHIQLLIKLAEWVGLTDVQDNDCDLKALIESAHSEITQNKKLT